MFTNIVVTPSELPATKKVSKDKLKCMTYAVLGEAGSKQYTSEHEMRRIVFTILNRVRDSRYPSTICGVVKQPRQLQGWERVKNKQFQPEVWGETRAIVFKWIVYYHEKEPQWTATHFYGTAVRGHKVPYWTENKIFICSKWHCYGEA